MNINDENLIYLETYKGIEIYQHKNIPGVFCFDLDLKHEYKSFTLTGLQKIIDSMTFERAEYNKLLGKLSEKERRFIRTLTNNLESNSNMFPIII